MKEFGFVIARIENMRITSLVRETPNAKTYFKWVTDVGKATIWSDEREIEQFKRQFIMPNELVQIREVRIV
jgi:hypothetical protein